MLRIADLLNNIGEDDSQLVATGSRGQVKLGRSVSAPERGARVDDCHEAAMAMIAMVDDDEHAASCPEDKQSPRSSQTSTRLRSFSRTQEKAAVKRSPRRLSPYYGSQPQVMTIGNIVNIVNPTEATCSGSSFGSPDDKADAAAGGKKRSTRSLFPELSESERRAKQRLIVKRCYYKKINTIKSLRSEANALEQQFRSALHAMQQEDEAAKAAGRGEDVKLREMFLDTLTTKESLREENIRLRRLADEFYMKTRAVCASCWTPATKALSSLPPPSTTTSEALAYETRTSILFVRTPTAHHARSVHRCGGYREIALYITIDPILDRTPLPLRSGRPNR